MPAFLKRLICGVLLSLAIAAAIFFIWMLWPRPLSSVLDANQAFSVSILTYSTEIDQETYLTLPQTDIRHLSFAAGSPEGAAVNEILSRYSYHYCWDTLTGTSAIDHGQGGDVSVFLWQTDSPQRELDVLGVSRCFIGVSSETDGTRIYKIGYCGNRRAQALTRELAHIFPADQNG